MANKLRFGVFEFDVSTKQLRRDGIAVRLQAQPSQVLAVLLQNPGHVVTRDALREAVWGSDTHVEFESGLNFCIAQIRSALGDSAESPLYIKTVPKRGYQFIAAVVEAGEPVVEVVRAQRLPSRVVVMAALAACFLIAAGWYGWSQVRRKPGGMVRIAVARFENQSGDASLDAFADGLTDAVVAELTVARPDEYAVIGNSPVLREPRDRQDLARIAKELNAGFVVLGQVQRASEKGRVLVHLIRLPDQSHRWVTRVDDPDLTDRLRTQNDIARRVVREFSSKIPR